MTVGGIDRAQLGPQLHRFVELFAHEEPRQEPRKASRVERLGALEDVAGGPPPVVEVVLELIVEPPGFVDDRRIAVEAHLNDDLVLQMTHVAMAKHTDAAPGRWAHLLRRHDDARLLAQLPHRRVDMRFPRIKSTTGQLPPRAELRGGDLARMEEQDAVL